nr:accessory gene regulator B family protein [uncultured Mediterraneibacter sp.]
MKYLSDCICECLVRQEAIQAEEKELYEYAIYSFFLNIAPIVIVLIIGSLLKKEQESIIVIFPFMCIRKFSGGMHAKKAWVCVISSCIVLFFWVWVVDKLSADTLLNILVFCAIFSLALFSPIDSERRHLNTDQKKQYRIITIFITIIFWVIYELLLYMEFEVYAVCIAEGIMLTAILQIPCVVKIRE